MYVNMHAVSTSMWTDAVWQVYVVEVSVKCGPKHIIYRRYNQFHNLSQVLDERYPIEAGHIDIKDRTLPSLPGHSAVDRVNVNSKDINSIRNSRQEVFGKECS